MRKLNFSIIELLGRLLMIVALLGLSNCSSSDELNEEMSETFSRSTRASLFYTIEGPDFLTTYADYKLISSDGSAIPSSVTVSWDYPTDFYKIGSYGLQITLGRKMAEGEYLLDATASNGVRVVSKSIKALECNISGPSEIITSASYQVLDIHGNNLPYGLSVVSWECPSGFSIINQSANSVSIKKGNASNGSYTLYATLSNGATLYKTVVVKSSTIDDTIEKDIKITPLEVSTSLQGTYKSVNEYLILSTGRYLVGDRFFLKCNLINSRTSPFTLNASTFKMSYGSNTQKYIANLRNSSYNTISSLTIPAQSSVTVYVELVGNWMYDRLSMTLPDAPLVYYVTNIYFYNNVTEIDAPRYNFLFSTREEQGRN